jgi:hypothetical protein
MSCHVRKMRIMAAASAGCSEPKTSTAGELSVRLAQIQAERDRQDALWTQPVTQQNSFSKSQVGENKGPINDKGANCYR